MTPEEKIVLELEDKYDTVTQTYRESRGRVWRALDNYWHGNQYLDDKEGGTEDEVDDEVEADDLSRKVVNIFRAHGEAIISALSVIIFLPWLSSRPMGTIR